FFRRAFALLRSRGTFGLIATNTIGQGDTRASGLRWICAHSGEIYHARKRLKWPGKASVVVSVVHVFKGAYRGQLFLDGRPVERMKSAQESQSSHGHRASVWWQHYHQAKDLYSAIGGLNRVLVISRIGTAFAFTFLPVGTIYNEKVVVFPFDTYAAFAALQCR